jgi:hypothetical protein
MMVRLLIQISFNVGKFLGIEFLEGDARQVVAFQFPNCHVLITSCNELRIIKGVKFNCEDWKITQISES